MGAACTFEVFEHLESGVQLREAKNTHRTRALALDGVPDIELWKPDTASAPELGRRSHESSTSWTHAQLPPVERPRALFFRGNIDLK